METQQMAEATKQIEEACKPPTPTVDQIIEQYLDDQEAQSIKRVNIFDECVKDGVVTVQTASQASEIARMMNRAEHDLEDAKAIAQAMIDKAQARVKSLEFLFSTPLEIWTSVQLVGKKGRSLLLEGGKLSLRTVPESVRTEDAEALLAWAKEKLPTAVEMVPKVKTDVVKEYEKLSQTVAPGRLKTPAHDSFKVSIPK